MKRVIIKYEYEWIDDYNYSDELQKLRNLYPDPSNLKFCDLDEKPVKLKSIKAYLSTENETRFIRDLSIEEATNTRFINRFKRKYENKPNLIERIFGFDKNI